MVPYIGLKKPPLHNLISLPPLISLLLHTNFMAGPPFDHTGPNTAPLNPTTTIKFLCSYGGKILPRYSDSKLRYVGGHTRVLAVDRSISFSELLLKLENLCGMAVSLKCQLPTEDLDALVSIKSDEDLAHLIQEYDGGSNRPSLKIRAFLLIPRSVHQQRTSPPSSDTSSPSPKSLSPRSSSSSSSFSSTSAVGSTSSSRFRSVDNPTATARACPVRPARKVARYAYDHFGNPSTVYFVPSCRNCQYQQSSLDLAVSEQEDDDRLEKFNPK